MDAHQRSVARAPKTAEERQAELKATLVRLQDGVESLRSSDGWRAWLEFASRMPVYSLSNQLLIVAQRPAASAVAGYSAWKALGRQVRRGETGIRILAPSTRRVHREGDDTTGPDETTTVVDVREASRRIVTGFRVVSVFDAAQTDGEPLPEPQRPSLLDGHAPQGLWDALAQQVSQAGFALSRAADSCVIGGANGVTDYAARTVKVRADVTDAQAVKTLAHELGHVMLHDPAADAAWAMPCRGVKEVEAESVAFLVTAHAGLDSSDYTFAYVAGWAAGQKPEALGGTAARILDVARTITTRIDGQDPGPGGLSAGAGSPAIAVTRAPRIGIPVARPLGPRVA